MWRIGLPRLQDWTPSAPALLIIIQLINSNTASVLHGNLSRADLMFFVKWKTSRNKKDSLQPILNTQIIHGLRFLQRTNQATILITKESIAISMMHSKAHSISDSVVN